MKLLLFLLVVAVLLGVGYAWSNMRSRSSSLKMSTSTPKSAMSQQRNLLKSLLKTSASVTASVAVLGMARPAFAKDPTNMQPSTLAESKVAAQSIKDCISKIGEMEKLGTDYVKMGEILGKEKCFVQFADNAFILTKSSALNAEDKVALGTIKRYGVVADAIIMLGGLAEALRAGGVEVGAKGGGYKDQAAIIDEDEFEDSEDDEKKVVDGAEIKKYLKLSRGSLEDINRMTEPILSKK